MVSDGNAVKVDNIVMVHNGKNKIKKLVIRDFILYRSVTLVLSYNYHFTSHHKNNVYIKMIKNRRYFISNGYFSSRSAGP